jgi:hypothetical protein
MAGRVWRTIAVSLGRAVARASGAALWRSQTPSVCGLAPETAAVRSGFVLRVAVSAQPAAAGRSDSFAVTRLVGDHSAGRADLDHHCVGGVRPAGTRIPAGGWGAMGRMWA